MTAPRERIPSTPPNPAVFGDYTLLEAGEDPTERKIRMDKLLYLLTGGFLRGYRTQVLGYVAVLGTLAAWAVGDMSLADLVNKMPMLLGGAGLITVGDKINDAKAKVDDVAADIKADVPSA